ncbi:MAG: glycosyltransferase family 39 protein [Nitrospiraceae bacterium]|nr:glycosyltransferase family 39 protein [Nitrospiraceae bacterium]
MPQIRSYYLPVLLVIVLTVSFFRLGAWTLFDVDEAVFAEATKEMVTSGDWLTPTYNGVNRYDKPIFFYWLMAASYKTFGINEFGARFPSALAGVLLCIGLFTFMKRETDAGQASYAVGAFLLSLYFVMYSHAAVTDMTLTLFITFSLLSFYRSLQYASASDRRARLWRYGFYSFSSLAFLTKGLIGIIFPFGIAGLYLLVTEGVGGLGKIVSPGGTALFLLISGPWYAAETAANGREFIDQFFIKHHFRRFTGVISGHEGPWYYYLPVLLLGLLPWIVYLPGGLAEAWRDLKHSRQQTRPRHSIGLFALLWFSCILLFFSLSTTKLPNYILPAIPAAVILISFGMTRQSERQIVFSKYFMAAASLLMGVGALAGGRYLARFGLTDTGWIWYLAGILFAGAALNTAGALKKKSFHEAGAVLMLSALLLLSFRALPAANNYLQGTLHRFSIYAGANLGEKDDLIVYRVNKPSIVFYSGHRVKSAGDPAELDRLLQGDTKTVIITKSSEVDELQRKGLALVDKDPFYALLERK